MMTESPFARMFALICANNSFVGLQQLGCWVKGCRVVICAAPRVVVCRRPYRQFRLCSMRVRQLVETFRVALVSLRRSHLQLFCLKDPKHSFATWTAHFTVDIVVDSLKAFMSLGLDLDWLNCSLYVGVIGWWQKGISWRSKKVDLLFLMSL